MKQILKSFVGFISSSVPICIVVDAELVHKAYRALLCACESPEKGDKIFRYVSRLAF